MRLRGEIVAEHGCSVIFQVRGRRLVLPKSVIRLSPNDYARGPHVVYLPRWLGERKLGGGRGHADKH
ncbi:MAG: hypothetical protein M1438_09285 [Deltaproteobacteria bacterium]|nr:hypothetical protein [Deltaproteobacteria bacterium]